ncbi:hypothetical protein [Naasia aerilata]|uniref:Uncharacterized protein n=1 Tax=Naasia aerilata TaxID=1162966 RepID=A0ABN6XR49_9MICO|nr:hypothetical protein [Naasia aerilata]BDZ46653.1 hypothetical protein GCM10025866_25620 [Naasia aerilata]
MPSAPAPTATGSPAPEHYTAVSDDTGTLTAELPSRWSDIDGAPYTDEAGAEFAALAASSDLDTFFSVWVEAGVELRAAGESGRYSPEDLLHSAAIDADQYCTLRESGDYDQDGLSGQYAYYTDCGPSASRFAVVVGAKDGWREPVSFSAVLVTEQDAVDWTRVLATASLAG